MTEKQKLLELRFKERIEEYGECLLTYFNNIDEVQMNGNELHEVAAKMCGEGYIKETRDGKTFIRKDPKHKVPKWSERNPIWYDLIKMTITAIFSIMTTLIIMQSGCQPEIKKYDELKTELNSLRKDISPLLKK